MLKTLEISGFKSFAKKTELHFKSPITAIVGPNGSGKSNVAEAFRFCLGEQSIKSMRGKRGEDLIWNGSAEVGRSNRAGVKLVLDNKNNLFSALGGSVPSGDFEEVIIERVVNRDGSNEYYLNGSLVRLKDIIELLSGAHIGASSHQIIFQGEADRILSANIKERKEMIEDALGLKIYQYKKEESRRKLLKTEENIKQVESLRREIAPHIRFLKKQAEKVEKAEELQVKLSKFYRQYLKKEQVYIERENGKIDLERKPIMEKMKELDKTMEHAKEVLGKSSRKDEKSRDLIEIENKVRKARGNKDVLGREAGKIEGEIAANLRGMEKLKAQQRSDESKTVLLREVEDLEKEISRYSVISEIINRVRSFIVSHKNTVDEKSLSELASLNEKLAQKKERVEEEIEKLDETLFVLDSEYQKIKDSIEEEKDSSREAEREIFRISSEQSDLRFKLNVLDSETKRMNVVEEDWKREIEEGGILLGAAIVGFESEKLEDESHFAEATRDANRRELEKMKIRLEELGGAGGAEMMKEYRDSVERDEFLSKELDDLKKSAESLEKLMEELLERLNAEFKEGTEKINKSFQNFFSLMFGGGEARLEIIKNFKLKIKNLAEEETEETEEKEPEDGIDINVSLPRKRTRGLDMLSGGERALTSIALLFAISSVNPPPFIVLDETDAALDEANSKKYGDMIESLAAVSQLILITHNRETMSRAGIIYGVTMGRDGVSRLLSIAFDEAVAVAK